MTTNRFDVNEVAFLELQLQELAKDRAVEIEYRGLQALNFVDRRGAGNPGMSSFAYYELDKAGEANWLASGSDDISLVDVSSAKQTQSVYRAASGFAFNMDELQEEAMANMGLIERRRNTAREAVMRFADEVAAFGDTQKGMKGFANHPNVPVMSAAAAAAGGQTKPWTGVDKTPVEIYTDLCDLKEKIEIQTDGNHKCTDILLPLTEYLFLSRTPLDSSATNSESILSVFKRNNPAVNVQSWNKLDNADSLGTGPRAVAYEKSSDNMEFLITDPLKEDPIYQDGPRRFVVPMTMKFGGVIMYRPLCVAYMDNI